MKKSCWHGNQERDDIRIEGWVMGQMPLWMLVTEERQHLTTFNSVFKMEADWMLEFKWDEE